MFCIYIYLSGEYRDYFWYAVLFFNHTYNFARPHVSNKTPVEMLLQHQFPNQLAVYFQNKVIAHISDKSHIFEYIFYINKARNKNL